MSFERKLEMDIRERIESFDKANGSCVVDGGFLLFESGGRRDINPLGAMRDPPENPYECSLLQLRFCEIRLSLAVEEFQVLQRQLILFARNSMKQKICGSSPDPEALELLKKIKKKVKFWQVKVNAAQANVEVSKPVHLRQREKQDEDNRRNCEDFLGELQKIEI